MRFSIMFVAGLLLLSNRCWPESEQPDPRHAAFEKTMSGSSLVGRFTSDHGKQSGESPKGQLFTEERYDILSVKKMEKGDYWFITTRIRYGELDVSVPVPVEVKWAGKTPVIMLDDVSIPGLGTFDAHVLIHKDHYAGTWRHDEKGGHLFGKIERTISAKGAEKGSDAEKRTKPE